MKRFLLFAALAVSFAAVGQNQNDRESTAPPIEVKTVTDKYYRYEIPAVLNGSDIDPAPFNYISADAGQSKLAVKYGGYKFNDPAKADEDIKNYGFVRLDVAAADGIATVFRKGTTPTEVSLGGGYTPSFRFRRWYFVDTTNRLTEAAQTATRWATWWSIKGRVQFNTYNILDPSKSYDNLLVQKKPFTGEALVSWNSFYNSRADGGNRFLNSITSIGAGLARTTNYASLKKRTLSKGQLVYNADSTKYQSVDEEISGGQGVLETYEGGALYGEYYVPLTKLEPDGSHVGSIYFGARATYYGIGTSRRTANVLGGFYFNVKKRKDAKAAPGYRDDAVNVALQGRFNDVQDLGSKGYWADKFSVSLSAAIPLRF